MTLVLQGPIDRWPRSEQRTAVTIGVYDGVHIGHRQVLDDLAERAEALGRLPRAVLTFDRHPRSVLEPQRAPKLLTTLEQRIERFVELGIDIVGVLPFDRIRHLDPEVFVQLVLVDALHAAVVAVGEDFRFGRDRRGDVALLAELGRRHGFEVDAVPLLREDDAPISSTAIRRLVAAGEVEEAARRLGRPFEVVGPVERGEGRGRRIGVPTANVAVPPELVLPAHGVYAGEAIVDDRPPLPLDPEGAPFTIGPDDVGPTGAPHPAAVNVGVRPTFDGERVTVEAHVLDLDEDLYGRRMRVRFLRRLREERRFSSVEELRAAIAADIAAVRALADGAPR